MSVRPLKDKADMLLAHRTSRHLATSTVALALLGAVTLIPPTTNPTNALGSANLVLAQSRLRMPQSDAFVENRGQWDAQAQFLARTPGVNVWVTETGVVYEYHRTDSPQGPTPNAQHSAKRRGHVVRMEFVGGRPSPTRGESLLEGQFNYLIGNDKSKWASNVPRYAEVRSERVYDGVEARWYFDQGRPRYDLIVAPGADPAKIAMSFEGANGVRADGRSLMLGTSLGEVKHAGLFAYQEIEGGKRQVPCSFQVSGRVASFKVGHYDRTRPLVIDPLIFSTLLGGADEEQPAYVALDSAGNTVLLGTTFSADFPTTVGAYDTAVSGANDLYVTKLSASGSSLLFSTFLGGSNTETARGVVMGSADTPIVFGSTFSTNFPTTGGAVDTTHNGSGDVIVTQLSADGATLTYSTFLGGTGNDEPRGLALKNGDFILVGITDSTAFPTTAGAFDKTHNGDDDIFATKFNTLATDLHFSTYLGGVGPEDCADVVLDADGNAIIPGATRSANFPVTAGAFDEVLAGLSDVFVTKLAKTGDFLLYSTYVGGAATENAVGAGIDASGNAFVAGATVSDDFPVTAGAFDLTRGGGNDSYVVKISADGASVLAGTYLGGTLSDVPTKFAMHATGNVIVGGLTFATDYPTTAGAYDATHNGNADGFVTALSPNLTGLVYSTYLGDGNADVIYSLTPHNDGSVVVAGTTNSAAFPTTAGAFDTTLSGINDNFVSRLPVIISVESASVPKPTFIGGFSVPMTVNLNLPASPGDVVVTLTTDTPGKVFVSQTKVKAGNTVKGVGVRTESVKVDTPVSVTATCNGVSKTVNFTLKPGGLLSLKLNPTTLSSFGLGSGTVALSASGVVDRSVKLQSSNAAVLYVPESVGIPAGQTSAGFPTFALSVVTPTPVTVTAELGTMKKTATLTVNP